MSARFAVALGSGSARGWAHVGVLRVLEAEGLRPAAVAGTSAGALIGAVYAAGVLDSFVDEARRVFVPGGLRGILDFFSLGWRQGGLVGFNKVIRFLHDFLGELRFEDLRLPFAAVATDIDTGARVVLRHGRVLDAVLASVALPGLFPPQRYDGRMLVDGGLVAPIPLDEAAFLGGPKVLAVNLHHQTLNKFAREPRGEAPPPLVQTLSNALSIMQMRIARSQIAEHLDTFVVAPRIGHLRLFEFHRLDEGIAAGVEAAEEHLHRIRSWVQPTHGASA